MKMSPLILALTLGVSGCDSIKKSVIQTDKNVDKLAVAVNDSASSSGAIQKLTESDFDAFTKQEGRLVVVDFYADWCGPCKELAPVLETLAVEYGDRVAMGKVNVDECKELAGRLEVKGIPDVRMYRNGAQVHSIVGAPPEPELRAQIEKYLGEGGKAPESVAEKQPNTMVQDALRKANDKEPVEKQPEVIKVEEKSKENPLRIIKRPKEEAKTKGANATEKSKEPEKPKEPAIQPMKKDWMPPGMQRKGG
jgi:thioredoxin 1